ncbi:hypothetical protein G4B88_003893 [Cannabis sativa]|uniref:Uncharacterized protein n=2 Tax=Cannabis sativa TaxID=3483 RepID=A0A7J6FB23_CANSA|nr:hypothetical protein G4B88_003893 [Cannabis sativa]
MLTNLTNIELGRIPSPIVTKKLKATLETEETDVEIETTSETKGTKQEQGGSTEEDPSPSLFSEEKEDPDKIDETEEIRGAFLPNGVTGRRHWPMRRLGGERAARKGSWLAQYHNILLV